MKQKKSNTEVNLIHKSVSALETFRRSIINSNVEITL